MWFNRILTIALVGGCVYVGTALRRGTPTPLAPPAVPTIAKAASSSRDADAALLVRRIREVKFENRTLEAALRELALSANVNLWIDWKSIEQAGVDREARFALDLQDVTFGQAVLESLKSCAANDHIFRLFAEDGIVTATTADGPQPSRRTECFNLEPIVNKIAPRRPEFERGSYDERSSVMADIDKWIVTTVAPDSWRDNGGQIGEHITIGSVLIVTQTEENLAIIGSSLQRLNDSFAQTDWLSRPVAATSPVLVMTGGGENARPKPLTLECFNIHSIIEETISPSAPFELVGKGDPRQVIIDAIKEVLTSNIDPESWTSQ